MNDYKIDELKQYIENSELVEVNKNLRIRLSKELLKKYEDGLYDKEINEIVKSIKEIGTIKVKYPSNAKPIYYVYIVPDENFATLLNFPKNRSTIGGGKIVPCYDLDGFSSAYGISSNMMERTHEDNIMDRVNNIHELAHMIHNMFYQRDRYLCEGFAEVVPLYILDYESKFILHCECILALTEDDILSVQEMLELEERNEFGGNPLVSNASCSFDKAYVSSYLFVRGCIEAIEDNKKINKSEAMQIFLQLIMNSHYTHQFLVWNLADYLDIDREDLLTGKLMQYKAISSIFKNK